MSWIQHRLDFASRHFDFPFPSDASADLRRSVRQSRKIFSLFVCGLSLSLIRTSSNPAPTRKKPGTYWPVGCGLVFRQVIFGYYKLVTHTSPYPSMADVIFAIGYIRLLLD